MAVGETLEESGEDFLKALGFEDVEDLFGKKVFDIGCGPKGKHVEYLRSWGIAAQGADKQVIPNNYLYNVLLDGENGKLPSEKFDIITAYFFQPFYLQDGLLLETLEAFTGQTDMTTIEMGPEIVANAIDSLVQGGELRLFPYVSVFDEAILGYDESISLEVKRTIPSGEYRSTVKRIEDLVENNLSHVGIYRKE